MSSPTSWAPSICSSAARMPGMMPALRPGRKAKSICRSPPTRSTVRWAPRAISWKPRRCAPTAPIPPARPAPICLSRRSTIPTVCPSTSPAAPTTTAPTSSPKSSFRCSSTMPNSTNLCPSTATGCRSATGCMSWTTARPSTWWPPAARTARCTMWAATTSGPICSLSRPSLPSSMTA